MDVKVKDDFFGRKKRELGISLNEVQAKAVMQTKGPLLLLASPGSGKTTTIIMRIGYLIEEQGVNPSRIKAVTFSRASASDMKERFKRFFPKLPTVHFSTIHSLAFEVVRDYFRRTRTDFQIIEGELDLEAEKLGVFDSQHPPLHKRLILRRLFQAIGKDNVTDDQMDELTTYISYMKNKMLTPDQWATVQCDVPHALTLFQEYEAFKKSGHSKLLVDFDDMLTIGYKALKNDRELLRKYQQSYDYVLTDESQDTSRVQHAIIEKLASQHGNLCVVADDDQSIYSWRGAEPSYLLNFKQVYPNAVTLFMEQNYRSSKDIVDVAGSFIKRNRNRYNKHMFTHNPQAQPIRIESFADYKHQTQYVIERIRHAEPASLADIAVLYRNNASSITLMNELDRAGIPFYMKDTDNRFFSHWVVEDILNFMRMTFTDKRTDILEKIHLKLNGYISKQQMIALKEIVNNESVFDNLLSYVQLQEYQIKPLQASKETFQQMKGMPPLEAIRVIRNRLGYEKALEKICERLGFRKEYVMGILNTLEEIADTLETMEAFAARLKHLGSVMKTSKAKKELPAVTLSTFHSAKGLEFEQVYMIDLIEGIIPSKEDRKGGLSDEHGSVGTSGQAVYHAPGNTALMEEATRLFYVGMTRARTHLELLAYKERDGEKTTESTFVARVRSLLKPPQPTSHGIAAAPVNPRAIQHITQLHVGCKVKHRVFGRGAITDVGADSIEIQVQAGTKRLSIQACLELGLLEAAASDA